MAKVTKTEAEWREQLTPEQFEVTRNKSTERPFSGEFHQFSEDGVYHCICCNAKLFKSDDKYDAECGWASFSKPAVKTAVNEEIPEIPESEYIVEDAADADTPEDSAAEFSNKEVACRNCDAHLGHLFPDGPKPTGLRYCINSLAITFEGKKQKQKQK